MTERRFRTPVTTRAQSPFSPPPNDFAYKVILALSKTGT